MFAFNTILFLAISLLFTLLISRNIVTAEPISLVNRPNVGNINDSGSDTVQSETDTCGQQLSKYRRFLLQAIISFEDVCDAYNTPPPTSADAALSTIVFPDNIYRGFTHKEQDATPTFFRNYQPSEQRYEIWAFFKLLMAQFNDVQFSNVIREAVIEHCRIKSQLQHDEKRNSVVLGKKQRFHSWGGKRAQWYQLNDHDRNSALDANFL